MKEMASSGNSKFNSALEIADSSRKGDHAGIRLRSWKVRLLIGFFVVLTVIFLMVLFTLQFTKTTKILRNVKTKRFVKMDSCREKSENTETVQNDILITPEEQLKDFNRRENQHPNHRYLEPKSDVRKKKTKDSFDESGLSPKPFDVKTEEYLSSIRNIISEKKPKGSNIRSKLPNLKSSGSFMRFKGIFGYASSARNLIKSLGIENFYYPQEINNLMQSYSHVKGEKNRAIKKAFKSHGALFQVPVKDVPQRERLNVYESSSSKPKQSWFKKQFGKKPLTILLNVYPVAENDDYFKKEGPKVSNFIKPLQNEFSKLGHIHSTEKFLFPQERRNGIIMKLNLYAKDREFPKRQNSVKEAQGGIHLNDRKRAEEKSFGWFSTKKKQKANQCSLMNLEPYRKHVTAKWKNKNGEWIHAKNVSVKYLN